MSQGFSIRIFVPSGSAGGIQLIEKSNWSGKGLICPRAVYPESKKRPEFEKSGVYILTGPSEDTDVPTVYIGEGDPVRPRLDSHNSKKDFWTQVIFFVSKDDNLNKAHIKHIESRLIQLAQEAKRCLLDNSVFPVTPTMSEMDVADAEGFLAELLVSLPILGINFFKKPDQIDTEDKHILYLSGSDSSGTGSEVGDGFVVYKGATSRQYQVASMHPYVGEIRKSLVQRGIFEPQGDSFILTQDYEFNSPSQAAAVLMGRNANGRIEWKNEQGVTLKQLQEGA